VSRPKQRRIQYYPLVSVVGEAILRYLREVRPCCAQQSVFLTLAAPIRPLSALSITPIVRSRLRALRVELPRHGAHCLRHACANHLLASGFSLKQIGDYLGHRSANSTLSYTKIDFAGLRQVAEFDLGGAVMKLSQVVSLYISHKRGLGYRFQNEEALLRSFFKEVGDGPIRSIKAEAV